MTDKVGLFAAAPSLMKTWFGASAAINASLDPSLAELVKIRSLADQRMRQLHQKCCCPGGCLMAGVGHDDVAQGFEPLRPKLMRIGYRMLRGRRRGRLAGNLHPLPGADRNEVRQPEA